MPELPEVETMVRGIRPAVEGRVIAAVRRCPCPCRPIDLTPGFAVLKRRLTGRRVTAVRRLAKRVVLQLDTGECCVIEPRMTGLLLLADPPDRRHLRLEWTLDASVAVHSDSPPSGFPLPHALWFWDRRGLGTVRLYRPEEFAVQLGPAALGPDALEMSAADWRALCRRVDRPIKLALLDQKLVAGIGNLYASEILHRAGIHPATRTGDLKPPQVRRLSAAVRHVLEWAIRYEGSTLGDGTYRNALNQNGRYQNEHRVYARQGQMCPTCGRGEIQRIVQAQRSTFFCPCCQG